MKTYNNLYKKIYSLQNLKIAFRGARKRKTSKWYVQKFEDNLDNELLKLRYELETQTYKPSSLKRFIIRDPKTRTIHASVFRDRVVHHALCNIIEPIFDKTFIYDSYACRKNKGSLAMLNRFDKFKRKVSCNGRLIKDAKDDNMIMGYVFKADIKHYFNTIDHEILINIIKRKIIDERILLLIRRILENNIRKSSKGMPLGNLTSQFFANLYLNELDYFVKHKLKAKYYMRYVDDFVILHKNKKVLVDYKKRISEFLKTLKIELHKEKSQIYPLHKGIGLLGFRMFYYYRLLCKKNIRRMEGRLRKLKRLYESDEISYERLMECVEGWCAYAMWANTFKLRNKIIDRAGRFR